MVVWSWLAGTYWVYFGLLFRSLGNGLGWPGAYRRAVNCFSRALRYAPENANLFFWRGTLYWRELRDYRRAEADLTQAIELVPRMARAYLNRAFNRMYAMPPDHVGAAQDLRAYLDCGDDPYWTSVARAHLQQLEERSLSGG